MKITNLRVDLQATSATSVQRDLQPRLCWLVMREYILERNHLNVSYVESALIPNMDWSATVLLI